MQASSPPPPPASTPAPPVVSSVPGPPPTNTERHSSEPVFSEVGYASWYGPPYHNRRGANGEIFDMNQLTAAHRTLPLNSVVRVTNLQTNHSTVVRITDRGPFVPDRIIDLSVAAAKAVDVWRPGTAKVRLDVLESPAAISQGGRWCVQIGAIQDVETATELKEKLMRRYRSAKVLEFASPVGDYWIRIRVPEDDKHRAEELARENTTPEGNIFLVRLD
ncbi:MAG TPA: septal ring lytic transglycosylase RlpA family protein [Terriglobales bacterium]|nr:septal ring lytic transglycosylase RlpA family protein [Terriglobales bacterium]